MKVKKYLLFLSLFSIALLVVACGSNGSNEVSTGPEDNFDEDWEVIAEDGASLTVWESPGTDADFLRIVAEEFEAEYGIPVTVEEVQIADAPIRMEVDGPAGVGADVFAAPHDHLGRMVSAGLVYENFFPEEYEGEFMDAAIEGTTVDGILYGYPSAIETYALFYNKDLVEEVPTNIDDFVEKAKGLTSGDQYGFLMEPGNFYFIYAWVGGYGGYVFGGNNTDTSEIGLNSEGAVKAAELMQRFRSEISLSLSKEDITYDVRTSLFGDGLLAFDINGPWAISGYRDKGVNFGVTILPELENGQVPTSFSGIRALYVNSNTKYPNAASLFAQFATSEEMLLKRFDLTGQLPPRSSLLEHEIIMSDEIASAFLQQAEYAVPMPNNPAMPLIWDPMEAAFTSIWNDNADPQQTLDTAVQQIEQAIQTSQ